MEADRVRMEAETASELARVERARLVQFLDDRCPAFVRERLVHRRPSPRTRPRHLPQLTRFLEPSVRCSVRQSGKSVIRHVGVSIFPILIVSIGRTKEASRVISRDNQTPGNRRLDRARAAPASGRERLERLVSAQDAQHQAQVAAARAGAAPAPATGTMDMGASASAEGSRASASFAGIAPANADALAMAHAAYPATLLGPRLAGRRRDASTSTSSTRRSRSPRASATTPGRSAAPRPGPVIHVREGQTGQGDAAQHLADAALGRLPRRAASRPTWPSPTCSPEQSKTLRLPATTPGVFMYHCGTAPAFVHIANGMYGAIVVEPSEPAARRPAVRARRERVVPEQPPATRRGRASTWSRPSR